MNRSSTSWGTAALILFLGLAQSADAQVPVRDWTVAVRVSPRKPSGAAWDAFGGAPDIAFCTSSAAGDRCSMVQGTIARCQDSFDCRGSVRVPATFSLTIWDLDVAANDLIGTCYIERPGTYPCGSATVTVR